MTYSERYAIDPDLRDFVDGQHAQLIVERNALIARVLQLESSNRALDTANQELRQAFRDAAIAEIRPERRRTPRSAQISLTDEAAAS
jgi:hydroxylamine reductase (hybrid-cluster protein)